MAKILERTHTFLQLPSREIKPRYQGMSILIDNGIATQHFIDVVSSHSEFIDFVKFGWCTSLITKDLDKKIEFLSGKSINFYFGGTLFEKALQQRKLDSLYTYFKKWRCRYVEISNGTINLNNKQKAKYISEFSKEFTVFSEVGYKDEEKSQDLAPEKWIEFILEDLEAGAVKVITEARESGRSGICSGDGNIKCDLIQTISNSGISFKNLIFEAPTKSLQIYFIKQFGANVNLANIPFDDVIGLETLRLGLRSDTLDCFEDLI